jgi:hypothetical protein
MMNPFSFSVIPAPNAMQGAPTTVHVTYYRRCLQPDDPNRSGPSDEARVDTLSSGVGRTAIISQSRRPARQRQ